MNKVEKHIRSCSALLYGERLLVAVSGGPDSVVLLDALVKAGFQCVVAHCNFHLRGSESDGDADFVKSLSLKYDVPFVCVDFDTEQEAGLRHMSIEMAARELRYSWFYEMAERYGCSKIAVAHNADDQAETFFLNLVRGAGLRGLSGMKVLRNNVVRPLLKVSRNDIMGYISVNGLEYRIDSTNNKTIYRRNKIRHDIMPLFSAMNPSFLDTMGHNMENISAAEEIVSDYCSSIIDRHTRKTDFGERIDISSFNSYRGRKIIFYELLKRYDFTADSIERIFRMVSSGTQSGKQFFSPAYRAVVNADFIDITPVECGKNAVYEISESENIVSEPVGLRIEEVEKEDFVLNRDASVASLDASKLKYPLILRHWQKGDRFYPFGMKGSKKLSDFFNDVKLSIIEKEHVWLLCSGDDIVWVVGYRIDARYAVNDKTSRVRLFKYCSPEKIQI